MQAQCKTKRHGVVEHVKKFEQMSLEKQAAEVGGAMAK